MLLVRFRMFLMILMCFYWFLNEFTKNMHFYWFCMFWGGLGGDPRDDSRQARDDSRQARDKGKKKLSFLIVFSLFFIENQWFSRFWTFFQWKTCQILMFFFDRSRRLATTRDDSRRLATRFWAKSNGINEKTKTSMIFIDFNKNMLILLIFGKKLMFLVCFG